MKNIDISPVSCHNTRMINKNLKLIWAKAAYQYIVDNSRRYNRHKPTRNDIFDFVSNILDESFRREVDRNNIYHNDVEEKIERILDKVIAEALKITYATSNLDKIPTQTPRDPFGRGLG